MGGEEELTLPPISRGHCLPVSSRPSLLGTLQHASLTSELKKVMT